MTGEHPGCDVSCARRAFMPWIMKLPVWRMLMGFMTLITVRAKSKQNGCYFFFTSSSSPSFLLVSEMCGTAVEAG